MKIRTHSIPGLLLSFCALCTASQAFAETLDAKAARSLVADRVWQWKVPHGGYNYWSWKGDGSVCFQLEARNAKCADTGTWTLDGGRLCYELTWWGGSVGRKVACFRISDHGKGQYEAVSDNGLTFMDFSVVE
jgi:hypothetical protein